ncbi:phosphotransferase [Shewanella glacialipiscicola]|uniref:phosphotransferase n=1 Tax=Shewanella glacialipiscicola TaxID=614069 RepID=UPI003D7B2695
MNDINAAMPLSSNSSLNALYPILRRAGLVQVLSIQELSGGLSNHNYKIITPTASYVLRVNTGAASRFCNREQECFYWQQLADIKLAPQLLWVSEDNRYYLSEFIESDNVIYWPALECQTRAADFVQGQFVLGQAGLRQSKLDSLFPSVSSHSSDDSDLHNSGLHNSGLHNSGLHHSDADSQALLGPTKISKHPNQAHDLLLALLLQLRSLPTGPYHISVTAQWQEYHQQMLAYQASAALKNRATLSQHDEVTDKPIHTCEWNERVAKLLGIQMDIKNWSNCLAACLIKPQFCHRDLNPHNLLFKNNHLYCIDFEYASASHPLCELAVVLATHRLTPVQQTLLVDGYLKQHPNVTADAVQAVPAAIDMYWVFACYWALLMAGQTQSSHNIDYLAWFDRFWPLITPNN